MNVLTEREFELFSKLRERTSEMRQKIAEQHTVYSPSPSQSESKPAGAER